MPLILLGLILIIGIIIYSIVRYMNADPGEQDDRPVRERYPHAFPPVVSKKHPQQPDVQGSGPAPDDESGVKHTESGDILFPSDNVETEKLKRNIH